MRRAERVEVGLSSLRKARQPALLAQGADAIAPTRQHLVGIALVAHIPHQLVAGRVEHRMERHGQFHDAER